MKKFNEDELAILKVIANSSQPITIKGKDIEGRDALGVQITSCNPNRRILYNTDRISKFDKEGAIGAIEVVEKENQVLIGSKIPVEIERLLGDHIQLRAFQLDDGEKIFKVNFVKIPKDSAPRVVFGSGKTSALLVVKNNRNINDIKITIKDGSNSNCLIKETKVSDLDSLNEMIQYLDTLSNANGKFFDAVKINTNDTKNIVIVDVNFLTETTSGLTDLDLKGILHDKLIKLTGLTKELNIHLLFVDKGSNSLAEAFGICLKVNIYINEISDEATV